MIIDFNTESGLNTSTRVYDVCIVGAGASGLVIANELIHKGVTVALCEAGGMEYTDISQSCYKGVVIGEESKLFPLDVSRLRYFGGSTGHWTGYCRPFTPIDFNRGYMGESHLEWPIDYNEINSYLKRATEILDLKPTFDDEINTSNMYRTIEFQFSGSKVGNFREFFIKKFNYSELIDVFLNSNLIGIDGTGNKIDAADFLNYNKSTMKIKARKFVFAMGGIETPRYMLWFSKKYGNRFFNNSTPIGKYWMEHPHTKHIGVLILKKVRPDLPLKEFNAFSATDVLQRENNTLGCNIICFKRGSDKDAQIVIDNFRSFSPKIIDEFEMNNEEYKLFTMNIVSEQFPSLDNSIYLSPTEFDYFGIPRVILNWKLREIDRRTININFSMFIDYIMEKNLGRLNLHNRFLRLDRKFVENIDNDLSHKVDHEVWETSGNHHMGALRMFKNDEFGVVDSNCKVFGSDNLYIGGSSVFTTGGVGNPTLPIIQLSLRLSEHLYKLLK